MKAIGAGVDSMGGVCYGRATGAFSRRSAEEEQRWECSWSSLPRCGRSQEVGVILPRRWRATPGCSTRVVVS